MRLQNLFAEAAHGRFPPMDGNVTVVSESPGPAAAVLGFTAHFVVCAPVEPEWVYAQLPPGDLTAPLGARFLVALADRLGTEIGANDAVFAAIATGDTPNLELTRDNSAEHPRVARAHRYRHDVQVWATPDRDGIVVLGRGVAERWEVSFEVAEPARSKGLGRALATAALGLLPAGTSIFAQVTPGNSSSMRAVESAGYHAIGGEVLLPARHK